MAMQSAETEDPAMKQQSLTMITQNVDENSRPAWDK